MSDTAHNIPEDRLDIPAEYRWVLDEPLEAILEQASPRLAEMIGLIGLEKTLRLIVEFQGHQIYVWKFKEAFLGLRDQRIRREFNGANHGSLATRYGLSVVQIYKILRPEDKQDTLFAE